MRNARRVYGWYVCLLIWYKWFIWCHGYVWGTRSVYKRMSRPLSSRARRRGSASRWMAFATSQHSCSVCRCRAMSIITTSQWSPSFYCSSLKSSHRTISRTQYTLRMSSIVAIRSLRSHTVALWCHYALRVRSNVYVAACLTVSSHSPAPRVSLLNAVASTMAFQAAIRHNGDLNPWARLSRVLVLCQCGCRSLAGGKGRQGALRTDLANFNTHTAQFIRKIEPGTISQAPHIQVTHGGSQKSEHNPGSKAFRGSPCTVHMAWPPSHFLLRTQ